MIGGISFRESTCIFAACQPGVPFCLSLDGWVLKKQTMKKLFLILLIVATGFYCSPAKNVNVVDPAVAVVPTPVGKDTLITLHDSASYAIGLSVVNFYKQQGVTSLNTDLISKAINDVMGGKRPAFNDSMANVIMNKYLNNLQEEKTKPNIAQGEAFLLENKKRPGVNTTASGLQYEVITQTQGPKPTAKDSVTCHYRGTLLNGMEVDNSYARGQPITFFLGRVIPGWTEGLQLMSVGSKYKFYIPYQLGYGAYDYGQIPGGSMLIFEVELLDIKKAK
jgi:FKBP-type peptidyl-prolyl cis-trans isomerase